MNAAALANDVPCVHSTKWRTYAHPLVNLVFRPDALANFSSLAPTDQKEYEALAEILSLAPRIPSDWNKLRQLGWPMEI